MSTPLRVTLHVIFRDRWPATGPVAPMLRLRAVLKRLLRNYGCVCVKVEYPSDQQRGAPERDYHDDEEGMS